MDVEQIAFTIIAHAGEAKSLAYSALREAEKNNFEKAENLIKEARTEINQSHQSQTDLLTSEANGEKTPINVLLIHSQDHLMTSMLAIDFIQEFIKIYKKTFEKSFGKMSRE